MLLVKSRLVVFYLLESCLIFMMKLDMLKQMISEDLEMFSLSYQGVVVACSAGLDSSVLLDLIYRLINEKKIKLKFAICHINFGLREKESDGDQIFVTSLASSYQVPLFLKQKKDVSGRAPRESIQMWARRHRYEFFDTLKKEGWLIALAHHKDDLAENIFLRLARGTSPCSLTGMSMKYGDFWRPLLSCSKKDLYAYAGRNNLLYRHDSSNDTIKYTRNKVRHNLLPSFEELHQGALDHLIFFAEDVKDLMSIVDQKMQDLFATHLEETGKLQLESFYDLNEGVARHFLATYLSRQNLPPSFLSRRLLSDALKLIRRRLKEKKTGSKNKASSKLDLPRGFALHCDQHRLWVICPGLKIKEKKPTNYPPTI